MTATAKGQTVTTQVFQILIKATPQAIWDAITQPEWTVRYGYRAPVRYDLRPGGAYRGLSNKEMIAMGMPEELIDGEVIEVDPPRKLVQTWRPRWSPETIAEGFTRLTHEIEDAGGGVSRLTLTHELEGAPTAAAQVRGSGRLEQGYGGWPWVLSDLKTLLESGQAM